MALFYNLCVKLRGCLCGVLQYTSTQPLVLTRASMPFALTGPALKRDPIPLSCGIVLDLANPAVAGLNWKLTLVPIRFKSIYGWSLVNTNFWRVKSKIV